MQQHPVPQNITSYEFHLIGNMTLKQFGELGAGVGLGFLIYTTNLPNIVKWPIIIIAVATAALIAFVPFEGRPLDQWVIAFIKAIYRPTQFYWKKSEKIPEYFSFEAGKHVEYGPELDLSPARQQKIKEFIQTLPQEQELDTFELEQTKKVSYILNQFEDIQVQTTQVVKRVDKPNMKTHVRSLQSFNTVIQQQEKKQQDQQEKPHRTTARVDYSLKPKEVVIPKQDNPKVKLQKQEEHIPQEHIQENQAFTTTQHIQQETQQPIQQAQTDKDLPFPTKPKEPNKIVGMVVSKDNKIIEGAIVEITKPNGMPVRAIKTNKLGQFFISTPLSNGKYYIQAEKKNYTFSTLEIELTGEKVDPVKIQAE